MRVCVARKEGIQLEPIFVSKNVINCIVYSNPSTMPWCLSAIYRPSFVKGRRSFWESIPILLNKCLQAKLLTGDFNDTLDDRES